jgi:nodulation protein E
LTRRVVVTGLGCISGLGQGVRETWHRALDGDGAIRSIDREVEGAPQARMTGPAAPIESVDRAAAEARFGTRALSALDPFSTWAAIAALEAIEHAGLIDDPALMERSAIILGCGSGGNASFDAAFHRLYGRGLAKVHPQTIPMAMTSAPASQIAMLFGMRGPAFVLSSACASSAHALGEAMWMIRSGRIDLAIAGGTEACLTPGSWIGWKSLGVIATETCRPFSLGRDGLALGEGAAILVLEERERAFARGATIHAELTGYGASADAAHITTPDQGGIEVAIRAAHDDAGLDLATPVLISSHGTGTLLNDRTEAAALRAVYGRTLDGSVVIATKSAHGHLIGGSGAIELLLGIVALNERLSPPVLGFLGPDPACDIPLGVTPSPIAYRHVVSNSFAFGGLNAVLIAETARN